RAWPRDSPRPSIPLTSAGRSAWKNWKAGWSLAATTRTRRRRTSPKRTRIEPLAHRGQDSPVRTIDDRQVLELGGTDMSTMTEKMSEANAQKMDRSKTNPKKGEKFRCDTCGMELEVTSDCRCHDPDMVHFECCGRQLSKSS